MAERAETRWSVIRDAAQGDEVAREQFARRYDSVIRAYLGARWSGSPLFRDLDDAAQETFLACFKEEGALARAEPERAGGFGAYLYGVVRNIARRAEEKFARRMRQPDSEMDLADVEAREEPLSRVFDRAWAEALLEQAVRLQSERARADGDGGLRRVELLELRFGESMPIRDIAARWEEDPALVHRAYARARREFAAALRDVVRDHHEGSPDEIDAECVRLAGFFR